MAAATLHVGGAFKVRLAGSKRTDLIVVEKVDGGQVSYRLTWMSKGERVVSPKVHTRPVGEVEVIAPPDLDRFVWKPGEVEVQEPAQAEEPTVKRPRTRRPRKEPATVA